MKERIIGAIVLVAVVVLVVPVFLDGPEGDAEMRTERVPLPGSREQKTQTVVLERNRKEPVPVATGDEPQPEPKSAQDEQEAAPVLTPGVTDGTTARAAPPGADKPRSEPRSGSPARVVSSSTGMWAVQLGSFSNQQNAERLAADLRKQGFAAFLSQLGTSTGPLHRVRVGPQKDRESADAMAARLQKAGHKGQVVPHP